jgi:predicted transcriptional regulator
MSTKRERIDSVAAFQDRDRSYILNQAIDTCLDIEAWQVQHIQEAVRQADSGEFASQAEVKKLFARLAAS